MTKSITQDFALIEMPHREFDDEEMDQVVSQGMIVCRGCTHHIIAGPRATIEAYYAEHNDKNDGILLTGEKAYARMLQHLTGQLGKTPGETQVISQFKHGWNKFQEMNSKLAEEMAPLREALLVDNRLIRNTATKELLPAYYETIAHDVSDQKRGERVLIIGDTNPEGNKPSDMTKHLVRQLANNRVNGISELIITHPDWKIAKSITSQLNLKGLKVVPKAMKFEEALNADFDGSLMRTDQVFVTLGMDKYPEADKAIISNWGEREAFGGKLIHLGNEDKERRFTVGAWTDANLWRSIAPEEIKVAQVEAKARNKDLVEGPGMNACVNCAYTRSLGGQRPPVGSLLQLPPEEYAHRTTSRMGHRRDDAA